MIGAAWNPDPLPLVAAAVGALLYVQAFLRLRRRGRRDLLAALLFALGIAAATLAVVSPLDQIAEEQLLSAHMAQHLLLGDVAPLLLVLGARGPVGVFLLPRPALRAVARGPVRWLLSRLLRPPASFALWAAAIAAWHVPQAYDAAIEHPAVHAFEHATLMLAGVLVWTQVLDPARRRRLGPGGRAAFAACVVFAGTILSEVLIAAPPLYRHYAAVADRPLGLTAETDQSRAGLLMMAEQIATLGTAAALLLWSHVERVQTAES